MVTNPYNKDIFAGGTFSGSKSLVCFHLVWNYISILIGDLYIWKYEIRNDGGLIAESFSETSQFGTIVGITWMKGMVMSQDYDLLTCHFDGVVVLWKIGKVIVKDKM